MDESSEILEYKKKIKELELELERYRNSSLQKRIINALDDLVFIINKEYVIEDINDAALALLKKSRDEVIGRHCYEILHNKQQPISECPLCRALQNQTAQKSEYYDEVFEKWFSLKSSPLFDENGQVLKYLDTLRDITNLKEKEIKLQENISKVDLLNEEYQEINVELNHSNRALEELNKKLHSEQERYKLLTRYSSDVIALYDKEHKPLYISPSSRKLGGYEASDFISRSVFSIVHPEDIEKISEKITEACNQGIHFYTVIYRIRHKEGHYIWVESLSHVIYNEEGEVEYIVVNTRDVDKAVKANEALLESETLFRMLFNQATVGIARVTPDGNLMQVNNQFTEITGYSEEELIDMNLSSLTHNEDMEKERGYMEWVYEGKTDNYSMEKRLVDKQGLVIWVIVNSNFIRDKNGDIEFAITTIQDISDRKRMEIEIQERSIFIRTVLDNLPIGVALNKFDEGEATYLNRKFQEIYGWDATVLKNIDIFFEKVYPDPEYREQMKKRIFEDVESGDLERMHWDNIAIKRGDGTEAVINAVNIPLFEQNTMVSTVMDVTEQNKARAELIKAKEKAEESDRLKSAFLANMSHEIRTPMNGIIGFSEMMMNRTLSDEKRDYFARIVVDSGQQLLRVVNDILDLSKIEAGEIEIKYEDVCVNDVIMEIFSFYKPQANNRNLTFFPYKGLSDGKSVISTDKSRLKQILMNLLNNAFKFTNEGHIKFGYVPKGSSLEFYVMDSGIGLSKEVHEKVFEQFRQVEMEMTRQYGGTGLGLTITKKLVELMGGDIWVESEPGVGATFFFTLPYTGDFLQEEFLHENNQETKRDETVILIAEDEEINYLFLEQIMSDFPVRILHARNGEETVEMFKKYPDIDLILMDIKMPLLNGYQATARIKKMKPDIPVIAQTAFAMPNDEQEAIKAGCDGYLRKPIEKNELLAYLKEFLNLKIEQ